MLLRPALKQSTSIHGKKARIVNLSSSGHTFAPGNGIEWCVLKDNPERTSKIKEWGPSRLPGKGAGWYLYGISKTVCLKKRYLYTHRNLKECPRATLC